MEPHNRQIEDLISQSTDPVQRATLITLQVIAEEFAKHREDFIEHDREDMRRWAGIKGAWWAFGMFVVSVQGFSSWAITRYINSNDLQETRISQLEYRMQRIELSVLGHGQAAEERR